MLLFMDKLLLYLTDNMLIILYNFFLLSEYMLVSSNEKLLCEDCLMFVQREIEIYIIKNYCLFDIFTVFASVNSF